MHAITGVFYVVIALIFTLFHNCSVFTAMSSNVFVFRAENMQTSANGLRVMRLRFRPSIWKPKETANAFSLTTVSTDCLCSYLLRNAISACPLPVLVTRSLAPSFPFQPHRSPKRLFGSSLSFSICSQHHHYIDVSNPPPSSYFHLQLERHHPSSLTRLRAIYFARPIGM